MKRMSRCVVVLVTCPNARTGRRVAGALMKRRLAACINLLPGALSLFRWKGKVDRATEILLIIKTSAARFEALRREVIRLHPYDVPEIVALPIIAGHQPYLRWIASSLQE